MNNVNFISYEPVNDQKFEGIATVEYTGTILLRYKMTRTKQGNLFPAPPSLVLPGANGDVTQNKYLKGFEIDSSKANTALQDAVMEGIKGNKKSHTAHAPINYPIPPQSPKVDDGLPF